VGVIGDVVGDGRGLGFPSGVAGQPEIMLPVVVEDRRRHAALRVTPGRPTLRVEERTVMLHQAFEGFPGEVETVIGGVAHLEASDDA
jgi:hypothetical protein